MIGELDASLELERQSDEAAVDPRGAMAYWREVAFGNWTYGADGHPITEAELLEHFGIEVTVEECARFWRKVDKSGDCWLWLPPPGNHGYGQMGAAGTVMLAHRISYLLHHTEIPDGLTIDHLCHVKTCVRPDHLEAVTSSDNVKRAHRDGLYSYDPECCPHGHPRTPEVWRAKKSGASYCIECQRGHNRRYASRRSGRKST